MSIGQKEMGRGAEFGHRQPGQACLAGAQLQDAFSQEHLAMVNAELAQNLL